MDKLKILVVDDESRMRKLVKDFLTKKDFEVIEAEDGEQAVDIFFETKEIALIILDVMMPKMDGFALAKKVRSQRIGTPILMLTARSSVEDRIQGLNSGADYYLTKPFDQRELLACINAMLRRHGDQVNEISFGNTSLELNTCNLVCGNERIRLSAREFDVMRILLQAQGGNLTKESILTRVWGFDSDATDNSVEVYIRFLRKKLECINSDIRIESIRRFGYHLEVKETC